MKNGIFVLGCISLAVLVGCGGGSGSSSSGDGNSLTISGTAATGAPISKGTVEYVCASGTGSGLTSTDGTYQVTVSSGALPCLGRVTASDNSVYHTLIADDSATTATANITPMTELVVASLAGSDTVGYYSEFGKLTEKDKQAAVTKSKVEVAQKDVKATLSDAGITTLGDTDLLKGTLKPGSSTDTYDKALETLKTNLATGGSNIKSLSSAVAKRSGKGTLAASNVDTTDLPAGLLLKAKAGSCAALRSTTYRYLSQGSAEKVTVDAVGLTFKKPDGTVSGYLKAVDGDLCHFQAFLDEKFLDSAPRDLVVSPAGFGVVRSTGSNGTNGLAVMFPVQTGYTLADAAGKWSTLSMEKSSTASAYRGTLFQTTMGSDGKATDVRYCASDTWDVAQCTVRTGADAASGVGVLRLNAETDGYDLTTGADATPSGKRYAYKTGSGDLVVVGGWTDGSFDISTQQRALATPVVDETRTSWGLSETKGLIATALASGTTKIASVADALMAKTAFLRTSSTTGSSPSDEHSETWTNNTPYEGFRYRAAGTDANVTPNQSFSEVYQLPIKGAGISVVLNTTKKLFQISVNKP